MTDTKHKTVRDIVHEQHTKPTRWDADTKHTDNLEECPFHSGAYFLDCRCNHTDSVEAVVQQLLSLTDYKDWRTQYPNPEVGGHIIGRQTEETIRDIVTTLQATQSQQVEEAVRKEAYRWFDTWFNYIRASADVTPVQDFGKWATERLQELGSETPNHPD